jgi:hypothetical protein
VSDKNGTQRIADGVANGTVDRTEDWSPFDESLHMLFWLGKDPKGVLRDRIASVLRKQVDDAQLDWVRVLAEPRFITGGKKSAVEGKMTIVRMGVAFSFAIGVQSSHHEPIELRGVASICGRGLDGKSEFRSAFHFDLHADLDERASVEVLGKRMYALDEGLTPPDGTNGGDEEPSA